MPLDKVQKSIGLLAEPGRTIGRGDAPMPPTTKTGLAGLGRRLGLGKLLYHTYHVPRGFLARCWREGPGNLFLSWRGRVQNEKAAYCLPPLAGPTAGEMPEVYFLTGKRFWYQTCFCAYSLLAHSPFPLRPVVYDDGSLEPAHEEALRRVMPQLRVVWRKTIEARLDRELPRERYPMLRTRRLVYPHLRKLTDIHAGEAGWKLVLDSDMLFFRTATFLLDWLRSPDRPCYMIDIASSYGYSETLLDQLAGTKVAERLNVGICGQRSEEIDWDRVEYWCRTTIEREGYSYYQEQALTALLFAGRPCAVAPAEDYVVLPSRQEAERPAAVMHHCVAESKAWFFRYGWRHILPR